MDGTKADLLKKAEAIEDAANRELRPMAADAAGVLAERGYHDVPADQLAHHTTRATEAFQGAMQYAQDLRRMADGMNDTERVADGRRVMQEAAMVEHAAEMGGWLSNNQGGAWDHAEHNKRWDDGREKRDLETGQHHLQQEADTARRTGVMVHNDYVPGSTVEQNRLVPNPNLPPYEDPQGQVPTVTERPPADAYPQIGRTAQMEAHAHEQAVNDLHDQVEQGMGMGADGRDVLDASDASPEVKQAVAELIGGEGAGAAYAEHAQDAAAVEDGAARWEALAAPEREPQQAEAEVHETGCLPGADLGTTAATAPVAEAQEDTPATAEAPESQDAAAGDVPNGRQQLVDQLTERAQFAEAQAQLSDDPETAAGWQRQADSLQKEAEVRKQFADEDGTIDWNRIEQSQGREIPQEERNALEMAQLRADSDALLNQAEHVEGNHDWTKSEIEAAAVDGETVNERWARQQADMDAWEDAQDGTAAVPEATADTAEAPADETWSSPAWVAADDDTDGM
jgi:hypothetical protein